LDPNRGDSRERPTVFQRPPTGQPNHPPTLAQPVPYRPSRGGRGRQSFRQHRGDSGGDGRGTVVTVLDPRANQSPRGPWREVVMIVGTASARRWCGRSGDGLVDGLGQARRRRWSWTVPGARARQSGRRYGDRPDGVGAAHSPSCKLRRTILCAIPLPWPEDDRSGRRAGR
jgi:hypothetical protein